MKKDLNSLLDNLPDKEISDRKNITVKGIADDSRKVKKGYLFIAVKGIKNDGHDYIDKAIKKGAAAVVGEKNEKDLKLEGKVHYIKVPDSRKTLGLIASSWFGNPSKKLKVIGITGTDGKTTTSYMVNSILKKAGKKAGLITTIAAKIGEKEYETGLHVTSPDPIFLQKYLAEMVKDKCEYAVIEVTSHGIDQKRIAGTKFDITALTNITHEHLDYHKTFAQYKKVKMAFLNSARVKIVSKNKTNIGIFPGKFNNLNAQVAVDVVVALGIDRKKAIDALHLFKLPKGRVEKIKNNRGINIYIDFAHTPNALENVLKDLKNRTKGRLIAVFGSAGERDEKKREMMGQVSAELADTTVLTAEDPRIEDVHDILSQMTKGSKKRFTVIPERSEAIVFAINEAKKGDTVAILGKAHEKSMAYGDVEHPWSDHEMVELALKGKEDMAAIILAAGKGTRMVSQTQKVLRRIAGKQMITYTLLNLRKALFKNIVLVVKNKKKQVIERTRGFVKYVDQKQLLGTGHAVEQGLKGVEKRIKTIVVLNGDDSAFYTPETIKDVIKTHLKEKRVLTFVSLTEENPKGLGRVIRDKKGRLLGIVEEKAADEEQKKIKEVNDGLYVLDRIWLEKNLKKIKMSKVGEYYLVDLVKIALDQKKKIGTYRLKNSDEWQGVNTEEQLKQADRKMRKILKEKLQNENN